MSQFRSLWFAAAIAAISAGAPAFAQDEGEDETETIESFTEEFEVIDGLFPLYRDPENGDLGSWNDHSIHRPEQGSKGNREEKLGEKRRWSFRNQDSRKERRDDGGH